MENASKALIIAGAILLAILLISFGMIIINQSRGIIDRDALDEASIQAFNEKFNKYTGTKVKGTMVRALIQEVQANNGNTDGDVYQITFKSGSVTTGIVNTKTYTVEITGNANAGGRVSEISIKQN